tara:strand:- start:82 stop:261 length:180 start_codon:yes stop_codon:yes gene_type:complete
MFKKIFLIFLFYIIQFHASSALSNIIVDKTHASLGVLDEAGVLFTDDAKSNMQITEISE